MSKPAVDLTIADLVVEPGSRVETRMKVRSNSDIVGEYRIFVPDHCVASKWAKLRKPIDDPRTANNDLTIDLLQNDESEIIVVFEPPAGSSTPAGTTGFVIAVQAQDEEHESAAVEGLLTIGAVTDVISRVVPSQIKGRRKGRCRVSVKNRGTAPVKTRLVATDFDPAMISIQWYPREFGLQPKEQGDFLVEFQSRALNVYGEPESFAATLSPRMRLGDATPTAIGAHPVSFQQKPWVSKRLAPLLALLPVLAIGAFFLLRSSPDVLPPNPPTEIAAVAGSDAVTLSWRPDPRSLEVEARVLDCAESESVNPVQLAVVPFKDVSTGQVPLPADFAGASLCAQLRSIGSDGQASAFSDVTAFQLIDDTLAAPTGLRVDGSNLVWDAQEGLSYEPVIDNQPFGQAALAGRLPIEALGLSAGLHEVQIRAVSDDDRISPVSNAVTVEGAEAAGEQADDPADQGAPAEAATEELATTTEVTTGTGSSTPTGEILQEPWVLFSFSRDADPVSRQDVRAFVASTGGDFSSRSRFIDNLQFRTDHPGPSGELVASFSEQEVPLGGLFGVVDTGGLSNVTALEYCSVINEALEGKSLEYFCLAFDAEGAQLRPRGVGPVLTLPPGVLDQFQQPTIAVPQRSIPSLVFPSATRPTLTVPFSPPVFSWRTLTPLLLDP